MPTRYDAIRIAAETGTDPKTVERFLRDPSKARRTTRTLVTAAAARLGIALPAV